MDLLVHAGATLELEDRRVAVDDRPLDGSVAEDGAARPPPPSDFDLDVFTRIHA
jgi:hypothetical protein